MMLLDCDMHFTDHEPAMWTDFPDEHARFRPLVVSGENSDLRLSISGQIFPKAYGSGCGNPRGLGHLVTSGTMMDRHEKMRRDSTAGIVLQPGFVGLSIHAIADRQARSALVSHYNGLLVRETRSDPFAYWVMLVLLEDLDAAREAIEEWREDPALLGVVMRPTSRSERIRWSDEQVGPFLELLAQLRLTLFLHGGTGCHQWSPLADAFSSYELTHAFGHMGEHMICLSELLCRKGGLPTELRVVLLESGVAWIPPLLDRLDSHHRRLVGRADSIWNRFSTHFATVPSIEEPDVENTCRRVGADNILYGSDFPHWDCLEASDFFSAMPSIITPDLVSKNTSRFIPRIVRERSA